MSRTQPFTRERAEEPPLTVKDLMAILADLPPDMQLIEQRYSDYQFQTASMWEVVDAVEGPEWLTRWHATLPPEQQERAKRYLFKEGN